MNNALTITLVAIAAIAMRCDGGAQDTSFTYQGELRQSGQPAQGNFNMIFSLWDAPVAGGMFGAAINLPGVNVNNGLFTVQLDFGAAAFDNGERWLQIAVNGVLLMPRQPITRAPYAIQTRGIFVDEDHNVGIGTTDPVFPLHVLMDQTAMAKANIAIYAHNLLTTGSSYGIWAQSESTSGRGLHALVSATSGTTYAVRGHTNSPQGFGAYFTGAQGSRNYFQRSVGIGTTNINSTLEVEGNGFNVIHSTHTATEDAGYAVQGTTLSDGAGVFGSGPTKGVQGWATAPGGTGVFGLAYESGITEGVHGEVSSPEGRAVYALATSATGSPRAIVGNVVNPNAYAGYFIGGRNYMQGFLGLNKLDPVVRLDVVGSIQYTGTLTDVSDTRLKQNIEPLQDALAKVMQIDGVYFTMTESPEVREVGFIAQNVQDALPEAVRVVDPTTGHLGVSYTSFAPLLVEAMKDLRAEKDDQIESLRIENAELRGRIERLEALMQRLASTR